MFSLIIVEDIVGDSEEGVSGVPCCAFRVKTQSKDGAKSSSIPRKRQQPVSVEPSKQEGGSFWV